MSKSYLLVNNSSEMVSLTYRHYDVILYHNVNLMTFSLWTRIDGRLYIEWVLIESKMHLESD